MVLLHEALRASASAFPERRAVIADGASLSFSEFEGRARRVAWGLQRAGVVTGDRVVVHAPNSVEACVAIYGVLMSGGVVTPVAAGATGRRLGFVARDSGARVVVASTECAPAVAAARGEGVFPGVLWCGAGAAPSGETHLDSLGEGSAAGPRDPGLIDLDLAAIIYTSGTTGDPKGVMLTHRNLVNTSGVIARYLKNTPEDVVASVLPLAFSYGLMQLLVAVNVGHTLVLERSFAFPMQLLQMIAERRVTGLPAVPTLLSKVIELSGSADLSSLRYMTNAAAPLPPAHARRLGEVLPRAELFLMYGQTECTRSMFLEPGLVTSHPESVGRAIENCRVWLVDEAGRSVKRGEAGELVVRGSNVMRGYWNNAEDTGRKLREGPIPGEKVLHTGDLFREDGEGLLYFVSRTDDVFKCRGEKVAPRMIEHALCEIPEVLEAAVVGVADAVDGTAIKAVIVARNGSSISEATVRKHCKARLEAVFMPKYIEFRGELPKTESGKLKRSSLVEPA